MFGTFAEDSSQWRLGKALLRGRLLVERLEKGPCLLIDVDILVVETKPGGYHRVIGIVEPEPLIAEEREGDTVPLEADKAEPGPAFDRVAPRLRAQGFLDAPHGSSILWNGEGQL